MTLMTHYNFYGASCILLST